MPNVARINSPFIVSGNPDTLAVSLPLAQNQTLVEGGALYAPGDLGCSFDYNDKTYMIVILDPLATAGTAVGFVKANQVAFWKDQNNRIVTNDITQCLTPTVPSGCVAGIFRVNVPVPGPGGTLMAVLVRGHGIPVVAGVVTLGSQVEADSTAGTAQVITAAGVLKPIGVARTVANPALIDVEIAPLA